MSGRHAAPEDPDDSYFDIELFAPPAATPTPDPVEREEPAVAPPPDGPLPAPPREITAKGVRYVRAGRTILDGVDIAVRPGESVAVMGPSGSGKTSLLALLAGLESPDGGTVVRDPQARTGLILQSYGLVGVLTGAENVEAPLQAGAAGRLPRADIRRRSATALAAVGLTDVADHLIEELSGGQQQRVAIARALATEPAVVFADELTAELDHDWKNTVVGLVLDVAARGGIVVVATHDPDLAGRCDRVVQLVDGRVGNSDGS